MNFVEDEGDEEEDENEYIFTIDFKDGWAIDFLEHINGKYRLPHLKQIHIDSLEFVNSEARKFFKSTITTCDEIFINQKALPAHIKSKVDINYYFDSFIRLLNK